MLRRWFNYAVAGWGMSDSGFRSLYQMGAGLALMAFLAMFFSRHPRVQLTILFGAVLWLLFYLWAWWLALKRDAAIADREYDRRGKYKLSKEYWNIGSTTRGRNPRKNKAGR